MKASPATVRRLLGVEVPTPMLPEESMRMRWLPAPSAMMMLFESVDESPVTLAPKIVLLVPVTIPNPVL